jgi:hypothetical protein
MLSHDNRRKREIEILHKEKEGCRIGECVLRAYAANASSHGTATHLTADDRTPPAERRERE